MKLAKKIARRVPALRKVYDERDRLRAELAGVRGVATPTTATGPGPGGGHAAPGSFPIPKFWERSYWEPTVQLPLRDYCRPGDVVFDVGANAGALSMLMSRLVGPRGIVCAFEASPRIVDKTLFNLVQGGCHNVTLYHKAIYERSGELLTLYPGTHLNDSLYNDSGAEGGATYTVETLALDDYVETSGLVPRVVKMDIEGAELDALRGARRLLERARPVLVLEQSPEDMRCHALLTAAGYVAIDLASYRRITERADFDTGVGVANVLFIHPDSTAGGADPYLADLPPVEVTKLEASSFVRDAGGSVSCPTGIALPPGRYACLADFSADGTDNEIYAGLEDETSMIHRYHTYTRFMASTYRHWLFALDRPATVRPFLRFVVGSDPTLVWRGASILRFPAFDGRSPPLT